MAVAFITLALTVFFGVFVYRRPSFEKKLLKQIPIVDWMNLLLLPTIVYFALASIVISILSRYESTILEVNDEILFSLLILVLIFTFIGNSIHFCGKVLWRYIPVNKNDIVYQVNEIFHDKLSHYLSFMGALVTLFLIGILEINHPSEMSMSPMQFSTMIVVGMVSGAAGLKAVLAWTHSQYRPISWLNFLLLCLQLFIFGSYDLTFMYYQYNVFLLSYMATMSVLFSVRTIMIITRLHGKRRMRFIAKLVSLQ